MDTVSPQKLQRPGLPRQAADLERLSADQWKQIVEAPASWAMRWMHAAAMLGHAHAQTIVGQWLLDGHGAPVDAPAALAWFLEAARQGHAMAMNMAGRCYENGWGTAANAKAAVNYFRQAANQGLDHGLYNLANQFAVGNGVVRSDTHALALYRRAAAMGHAKSMTKAGRYHEEGIATERNRPEALHCYRGGAEGGDFRGQYHLARLLAENGDMEQALSWLQRVPSTATPRFLEAAGRLLVASPDPRVRMVGDDMLAQVTA